MIAWPAVSVRQHPSAAGEGGKGNQRRLTCAMRRPRGQAAELILQAVSDAHPEGLTLNDVRERTQLPRGTVQDNVKALAKAGKIETFRGDERAVWVCLPD